MAVSSSSSSSSLQQSLVSLRHPTLPFPSSFTQHLNFIPLSFRSQPTIRTRVRTNSPLQVFSLLDNKATVVTGRSWDKLVLKSEMPVLVEFHASWCGPCRMVHRVIDEVVTEYAGRLKCYVLHADNDLEVAENYDIKAVPVVLLFKNGEKCASVAGTMPKEFYMAAIERVLSRSHDVKSLMD